jgi:dipeptidyl aminopeptidase/acylaminoacyl peptidase
MPLEGVLRRRDRRRRNQRIAAGMLGIAVVLVAAAGGASLLRSDSRPADPPDPGIAPILRVNEVLQPVDTNGPGARLDALDPATGAARTLAACADPCGFFNRYALSPDGRWLAYEVWTCVSKLPCEPEAGVWVTNAAGDQRQLTSATGTPWTWSAQGATLLVADGHKLFAVDPFDASRTPLGSGRSVSALAGSPDGSLVAFGDRSSVWAVSSDSGGVATRVFDHDGSVGAIDWSPDGTRLAVDIASGPSFSSITVVDLAAGTRTAIAEGSGGSGPALPTWSPDGSRIAYVTAQSRRDDFVLEVWVANLDGSSPVRVFRDRELGPCCPYGSSSGPVWSPDGSQIAFDAESLGLWFVVPADGSGLAEPFSAGQAEAWRIS